MEKKTQKEGLQEGSTISDILQKKLKNSDSQLLQVHFIVNKDKEELRYHKALSCTPLAMVDRQNQIYIYLIKRHVSVS